MRDLDDQKNEQIHEYALNNVPKNLEILGRDSRFQNHTETEILIVAYFRGYHDIASAFKGDEPNFALYDSTMSDRKVVQDYLPQRVEGLDSYMATSKNG